MKTKLTLVMMFAATTAMADSHSEKKDAMKKAPDAKGAPAPKEAPKPAMEAPKPAPEIAAMAKSMAGNWKCAGKMVMDPSKPDMADFSGTFKAALTPDKWWVKGDWTAGGGKMKGMMFVTYDAAAKKWYRHMMDNMGMGGMEWSSGLPAGAAEGKMVWEGEHHGMGMQHKTRNTEEVAAKSNKMTSEVSMDGGKTWKTMMEMTCTK